MLIYREQVSRTIKGVRRKILCIRPRGVEPHTCPNSYFKEKEGNVRFTNFEFSHDTNGWERPKQKQKRWISYCNKPKTSLCEVSSYVISS